MVERKFDSLGNAQMALKILRLYNQYVLFPVDEVVFESPALIEYFDSPLDSTVERNVEKMIAVAGINAVYDNPNIPESNKKQSARNTARDLRDALRIAKLEHHASIKKLSVKEYNRRKQSIGLVGRRMKVQIAKTLAKNAAITTIATVIAGPIGGAAAVGARILGKLMPEKVKKPIIENANEAKEKALNVLENSVEYIKSTTVGNVVQKTIDTVKPTIKKVVDTGKNVFIKVKDFAKSFWPF